MSVFFFATLFASVLFTPEKTEIVVAPDARPIVRFAAEEAQAVLTQAFGSSVPVVDAPTAGKASLVLGPTRWADAAGVTTNGLVRDAYRLRTVGTCVYVVGIDDANDAHKAIGTGGIWLQNFQKATLFGTYEFLERFAGARFYFPGELGTVVPKRTQIEVPETDLEEAPVYTVRRYTLYDGSPWFEGPEPTKLRHAAKTLQWWRNRQETRYLPCCHGQNKFRYMDRFAASHPEYFALLPDGRRHNSPKITSPGHPGQICHSSRIWDDEIYADAKAYLTGQSAETRGLLADGTLPTAKKLRYAWGANCQAGKYVDVMPQDGMIKCSCPTCQAYYKTAPAIGWASELIWGNVARLANRLKAEGVPGYLTNLAYSKTRPVPKVAIPDNVVVGVAERGPWTDRDPKERTREIAEIKAWNAKLGHKVWLWTYSGKFAALKQDAIPPVTPRAIGKYYQQLEPWIFGGYEETDSERSLHNYLNAYVFGKVCWNPKVDVDAIVDEHHRLMFGAAAPEMKAFFDALEEIWLTKVAGETVDTALGPQSKSPTKRELYTTVYSPAVIAGYWQLFDAAAQKVAADSIEGRRVALMKKEILDPLVAAIDAFQAKVARADASRFPAGRSAERIVRIDRRCTRSGLIPETNVVTKVAFWRTSDAYHFVYDCEEPLMDGCRCAERRPDDPETWNDNGVELHVNPSADRVTKYQFMLASSGAFCDLKNGDVRWNSGARTAVTRTPHGWRATIEIPRAAFPEAKDVFPANFCRTRVTSDACTFITWGPYVTNYGDIDNFSVLDFSDPILFTPETAEIVVAPDAVSAVRVAADEAKEFLSKALGAEVPVVQSSTPGKASLVLGPNAWADAAGVTTNGLRRDEFRIRTDGGRVYVLGIDEANDAYKARAKGGIWLQNFQRATAFGVYEFLERFVGVRFYFPGELGTVVPRRKSIAVPSTDLRDGPANTVRRYSPYDHGRWFEGEKPDELRHPAKTLNWWRLRMETEYLPCCHGSARFQYLERFAAVHPEYFALLKDGRRHNSPKITSPGHPGQLCHSSAIWDEIYEDAKSYLKGEPASVRGIPVDATLPNAPKRYGWGVNCQAGKYVDIMPQDGMIQCTCPACQKVWDNVEDKISWASELIWGNVARLANRLKAEGVPGYVSNLAYSKYRHVPKVDIPDNVLVMVAERGPWTEADPAERARELAEVKAWTEKLGGRKVWLWNYANKAFAPGLSGIPEMTPKAVGHYYQKLRPLIFGAFMESENDWSIFNYLNYYVFAKVMWSPDVDVESILDEHHRLMFGAAALEMKDFYETLERIFVEKTAGPTLDTPLGPQSVIPSEYDLFMRIYTPAVVDGLEALIDRAEKRVASGSIESRRLKFVRENLFAPLAKRARTYVETTDVKRGLARDKASTAKNLISNGDFSLPKKGRMFGDWFGVTEPGVTELDTTTYASAPQSLRLRLRDGKTTAVSFYFRDKEKKMTLKKGQKYRLSYCIKLEDVDESAGVTIWDNKNIWIPKGSSFRGTQDWTYQVYEFTSDAHTGEKQMPYIYLRGKGKTGTIWFDDVRLEEVE